MLARLRALFRRAAVDRELDDEMQYHLEQDTARNIDRGMTPDEARLEARRRFGNVTLHAEAGREAWGWTWLEQLAQDLRYGTRALFRTPTFTAVAVLSLALGIGTNTAIFGLLYNVLVQPLAVPHPEQLAVLIRIGEDGPDQSFSYDEFRALGGTPGLTSITAERDVDNMPVAVGEVQTFVNVLLVDESFYATFELLPHRGRLISAGDVSHAVPVAVVSPRFAHRTFGSEDSAVGRTILIRDQPFTVVGITPPAFRGLDYPGYFEVAVPLTLAPLIGLPDYRARPSPSFGVIARLADPRAWSLVQSALDRTFQRCCAGRPAERLTLEDMSRGIGGGKDDMRGDLAPILYTLMGCVVVVLLIACANVGNLLLLRAAAREREIAVRLSLGSSRSRIVRQLLTESAFLGIAGAALGLPFAAWTTALLIRSLPDAAGQYVDLARFHVTPLILGFTALAAIGSVLIFGLAPALHATRGDIVSSIKVGGHAARTGRGGVVGRSMVVIQVALALALVSIASLLVTTLRNLASQEVGVSTSDMIGMGVETRGTGYESQGIVPLYPEILRSVESSPGVRAAGMATFVPLFGGRYATVQFDEPDGSSDASVLLTGASPGYFDAAGIQLLAGRAFRDADHARSEPVAIISEAVARRRFGGSGAIGATIRLSGNDTSMRRVIGVVGEVKLRGPRDGLTPAIYAPLSQMGTWPYVELVVRTGDGSPYVTQQVIAEINRVAPGVRVRNVATVREKFASWLLRELIAASLASLFGVLALGLAAIGLYGVIAYNVMRRTNEIGVRMALGARAAHVVALVVRHSLTLVGFGVLLGAPLVYAAGRAVAALLYGVGGHDAVTLLLSLVILTGVAVAATMLPAMRAARIDPLLALRHE